GVEERLAEPRGIRDLEPAPDAERGRREHDVGLGLDDGARVGDDAFVVARVLHAQGRSVHHLRTPAFEGVDQIGGPALTRDPDAEPLELRAVEPRHELGPRCPRHGAIASSPARRSTASAATSPSAASRTTSPITITAGERPPARAAAAGRPPTRAPGGRCPLRCPRSMTAAGVSAASPAATSPGASAGRALTPMSTTIVPPSPARWVNSDAVSGACPEITVNAWLMPRCVSGIPDAAGTATALVTPGITSTGTPARRHARTSSPPRPKMYGSPPF